MESVFIPLNVKNKNGRIYIKENIENSVEEFLNMKNRIGVCYGEFDHPDSIDISLSKVSHTVDNIWFQDNKLMGEITPLNTHWGKELKELIFNDVKFSVRPRSAGIVDPNGYVHLSEIFTFDIIPLENDSFYDIKIDRKMKLEKLAKIENDILTEYYIEEKEECLPKLNGDFHILKNNFIIND